MRKTWEPRLPHSVLLDILKKKKATTNKELFKELNKELKGTSFNEFSELLMRLEINGKIRTVSLTGGKRRIELIP